MKKDTIISLVMTQFLIHSFIFLSVFMGLAMNVWEEKQDRFDPLIFYYVEIGFYLAPLLLATVTVYFILDTVFKKKPKVAP